MPDTDVEYIVKLGCFVDFGDGIVNVCVGDTDRLSVGLEGDYDCKGGGGMEGDSRGGQEGASDL